MNARRLTLATLVSLCVAICGLVAGAGLASAAVSEFGSAGGGSGQFGEPQGLAVDQESGDVYVVDRNNDRVEKFGSEGQFLLGWGWGVKDGAPALQTCSVSCFPGNSGSGAGQFEFAHGVAVDESGLSHDVYVMDSGNARVQKFSPTGEFLLMFGKHVNATTNGDVCVAGEACQAGEFGSEPGAFSPAATSQYIAVSKLGVVYVGDANRVQKFASTGALAGEIALTGAGEVTALSLGAGGGIYVEASELSGVHEYQDCAGVCAGVEIGTPLDTEGLTQGVSGPLAVGPLGELFVADPSGVRHILEYGASGEQLASFDAGGEDASHGLAFGDAIERVYTMNRESVSLVALPPKGPLVLPGSVAAGELMPTMATFGAKVNAEGDAGVSYRFEYGPTAAYGASTAGKALNGGFEDQTASAPLSELQPDTLYHFRIVVTSGAGETVGSDETFTSLSAVPIDSESVSSLTSESARLAAELNPLGQATEYNFEYGSSMAYGARAPEPDASAGSGTGDITKTLVVEGLQPSTTYHFRVVAHNRFGTTDGPDRVFVTMPLATAGSLADGRAWELVSPVEKHGVRLEAIAKEGAVIQASEDGSAFTYVAKGPITPDPESSRSAVNSQLLSIRGAQGWSTEDISTRHESVAGLRLGVPSEYTIFSPTLSAGLVEPEGTTPLGFGQAADAERTPYRREADGSFTPLVTADNVPTETKFGGREEDPGLFAEGANLVSATSDLSHVIIESPQDLDTTRHFEGLGHESLYEWEQGALHLVSVLPNGVPAAEEGFRAQLGFGSLSVWNAVSANGSRIFFEAKLEGNAHLYVRDTTAQQTAQIDLPEAGVFPGGGNPKFQTASVDGRRVFFTDEQRLTINSRAGTPAAVNHPDLYTCEIGMMAGKLECGNLKDLSVPLGNHEQGSVLGEILGSDEAADSVYFVANGRLTPDASAGDCEGSVYGAATLPPTGQSCGLYRYSAASGAVSFVATLSNRDAPEWEATSAGDLGTTAARESGDGRYFAFMSQESLTGYDNVDARSGVRDEEVFVYDSAVNSLRCVSCASSGARPDGVLDPPEFPGLLVDRPKIWEKQTLAGSIPGWTRVNVTHALYPSRVLSNNGRLFFDSPVALVPQDTNGKGDVYEYEPAGVGTCHEASGCVNLMSGGRSSEEAAFLDASSEGEDVFFLSASKLVPADTDGALDVYDAHVCSAAMPCGAAGPTVTSPSECVTAESCRSSAAAQPAIFGAPSSATFMGRGNIVPQASPKPVVKKALTRAQKLGAALKACKQEKKRGGRVTCEKSARRRYGAAKKAKKSAHNSRGAGR